MQRSAPAMRVWPRLLFLARTDWLLGEGGWHTQASQAPLWQPCAKLLLHTLRVNNLTLTQMPASTLAPKQHLETSLNPPPPVLTAFPLVPPGTSGSDLALTKPPSQIGLRRAAEPSLLDLSREAGQKPSAPFFAAK